MILIFDGVCVLCSRAARLVRHFDRDRRIELVAAQSIRGQQLQAQYQVDVIADDTLIWIEAEQAYVRSEAVLAVAAALGWWPIATLGRLLPLGLRNWVYRWVARNRYRWFGTQETCELPQEGA